MYVVQTMVFLELACIAMNKMTYAGVAVMTMGKSMATIYDVHVDCSQLRLDLALKQEDIVLDKQGLHEWTDLQECGNIDSSPRST